MKYYITANIHGFNTELHKALDEAGYFTDPEPHELIILGDLFDRGHGGCPRRGAKSDRRDQSGVV